MSGLLNREYSAGPAFQMLGTLSTLVQFFWHVLGHLWAHNQHAGSTGQDCDSSLYFPELICPHMQLQIAGKSLVVTRQADCQGKLSTIIYRQPLRRFPGTQFKSHCCDKYVCENQLPLVIMSRESYFRKGCGHCRSQIVIHTYLWVEVPVPLLT